MPAANFTNHTFLGDGTQSTFLSNVVIAMTTLGYALYDSYNDGQEQRVFRIDWGVLDPSIAGQTYVVNYLRIGFSGATSLIQQGYTDFNNIAHTGTNPGLASVAQTVNLTANIALTCCDHPEFKQFLWIENGFPKFWWGLTRPANPITNWSWNNYPVSFYKQTNGLRLWTDMTPLSSVVPTGLGADIGMSSNQITAGSSAVTGNEIIPSMGGVLLTEGTAPSSGGVWRRNILTNYSNDFGWAPAESPKAPLDTIIINGSQQYKYLVVESAFNISNFKLPIAGIVVRSV
ncbi:MAG: hypothetical protein QNJ36_19785 [Calothrix sp. MO_167.B42]|nr:hypothetical protein [Calothrix sp. MO_167.B42]